MIGTSKVIEARLPCPNCTSSDAYHVYDDGHGYCFSCEYYSSPENGQLRKILSNDDNIYTYEYLPWRKIRKEVLKTFDTKTKIDAEGKPISIGFRYPNGDTKVRLLDHKEFFWIKGGSNEPTGLFGQDKFTPGSHKYVTITEGEL